MCCNILQVLQTQQPQQTIESHICAFTLCCCSMNPTVTWVMSTQISRDVTVRQVQTNKPFLSAVFFLYYCHVCTNLNIWPALNQSCVVPFTCLFNSYVAGRCLHFCCVCIIGVASLWVFWWIFYLPVMRLSLCCFCVTHCVCLEYEFLMPSNTEVQISRSSEFTCCMLLVLFKKI